MPSPVWGNRLLVATAGVGVIVGNSVGVGVNVGSSVGVGVGVAVSLAIAGAAVAEDSRVGEACVVTCGADANILSEGFIARAEST